MILGIILAQLFDILLCRLPQILHVKLPLLILLIGYSRILNPNLLNPLSGKPPLSLLLFSPIFFQLHPFSLFLSFKLFEHFSLLCAILGLRHPAIGTPTCLRTCPYRRPGGASRITLGPVGTLRIWDLRLFISHWIARIDIFVLIFELLLRILVHVF